jgi:hypothetical protein
VGAAALAILVASRNRIREQIQKCQIKRELDGMNIGSGLTGVTTSVHNETGRDMVVRQVAFLMDGAYMILLPAGELTSAYRGQSRKLTRAEIKRVKKGEMVQMEAQMQFASWKVPPTPAGFVPLPPYTKTSFLLPAQFLADSDASIEKIRVVLEYVTRTGDKNILQHGIRPQHRDIVSKTLNHFREELSNGNLNKARRMFGMPEVVRKPKK